MAIRTRTAITYKQVGAFYTGKNPTVIIPTRFPAILDQLFLWYATHNRSELKTFIVMDQTSRVRFKVKTEISLETLYGDTIINVNVLPNQMK